MGTLSKIYNIGKNLIRGSIILSYVNTAQTPDCNIMESRNDRQRSNPSACGRRMAKEKIWIVRSTDLLDRR